MKQNNLRGHGFFRKSKAYGLVCGVTLATALTLATTTVSADQTVVTTPNPATNLVEAQEPSSHSSIELAKEAGQQSGELVTSVTSQELTNALDTAKNAGVTINPETAPITHTSLEAAQNDLSAQFQEVATVTAKQEANTEAIKEANNTNADIDRQNKAEAERIAQVNAQGQADVEARNRQGQADVDARNRAGQAEVDRRNQEALTAYETAKAELKARNEDGKAAVDTRNRQGQAEVDAYNRQEQDRVDAINADLKAAYEAALKAKSDVEAHNAGVRERNAKAQAEAEAENARLKSEYEKLLAEAKKNINKIGHLSTIESNSLSLKHSRDPKVTFSNLKGISFDTNTIESAGSYISYVYGHGELTNDPNRALSDTFDPYNGDNLGGSYHLYSQSGTFSLTTTYTQVDGVKHNGTSVGKIVYDISGTGNIPTSVVLYEDPVDFVEWAINKRGPLNLTVRPRYYDQSGNRINVAGNSLFYIESLENNIHGQQAIEKVTGTGGEFLFINGSTIKRNGSEFYSPTSNYNSDDEPGYLRAIVFRPTSNDFSLTFSKTSSPIQEGNYIWVGLQTSLEIGGIIPTPPKLNQVKFETEKPIPVAPVAPKLETPNLKKFTPETFTPEEDNLVPPSPETFTPEVFTPASYKPLTPTVIPHVPVPQKEQYAVSTHPVLVKQTPKNHKDVFNSDGISVEAQLVAKGDWYTWVLTNDNLKAGRDELKDYFMRDPFSSGIEIDWAASMAKSPAWLRSTDEAGVTILSASPATLNSLNANRQLDVTVPVFNLVFRPLNDGGTYVNTFETVMVTAKGEYKVVSNTSVIYTPGNNPQTPRPPRVPGGETPTPNDNLIQPKKDMVDEDGQSINGKSVLPNAVLNYVAEQDFDQYKGMSASRSVIAKGFLYVDDYLDKALDGQSLVVNSITAANGDDVSQLLEMRHVLSQDTLDEKLQTLIKESGISPVGEFYLWVAKDPEAFYKAYVQKGLDITYNLSFKIKQDFVGTITNQTYQVDFGNGYYGNVVTNEVPSLIVHKEVLDKDGQSIDGQIVKLGDKVTYKLEGWVIPAGRGYDIHEYRFVDLLQASHDKFETHKVKASVDITLPDGTVIVAGSDLMAYTETIYDAKTGLFELRFKEDFLGAIPRTSAFGADVYLTVERITSGEVVNEYTLFVNGNPVVSNKVTTTTPEPPVPQTPQTPEKPVPSNTPRLPETGEGGSLFTVLAGALSSILGLLGFGRKKD